jgi:hypothetical protein
MSAWLVECGHCQAARLAFKQDVDAETWQRYQKARSLLLDATRNTMGGQPPGPPRFQSRSAKVGLTFPLLTSDSASSSHHHSHRTSV